MMELVDKVIKIIIVTLFHMLNKDMEGIKMTQTDIITICDKKNTMNQVNSRLEITEEKISELETRQQKLSKIRLKKDQSINELWNNFKWLGTQKRGKQKSI